MLVPGGAANTRMVPLGTAPYRSKLIDPAVMVAPLIWLCSNASDGVTGQRFIAARWDKKLPPEQAAKKAGAVRARISAHQSSDCAFTATPAAWQQLGRPPIMPEHMR